MTMNAHLFQLSYLQNGIQQGTLLCKHRVCIYFLLKICKRRLEPALLGSRRCLGTVTWGEMFGVSDSSSKSFS